MDGLIKIGRTQKALIQLKRISNFSMRAFRQPSGISFMISDYWTANLSWLSSSHATRKASPPFYESITISPKCKKQTRPARPGKNIRNNRSHCNRPWMRIRLYRSGCSPLYCAHKPPGQYPIPSDRHAHGQPHILSPQVAFIDAIEHRLDCVRPPRSDDSWSAHTTNHPE